MRLAAAITRLTRVGAEAGAITRPSTSVASSGGGGGGSKVAPPLVGFGAVGSANAVPAAAGVSRHAVAAKAARSKFCELTKGGILFRTPAGLADGLALKELARLLERQEVRPSGRSHLGSPAPRYADSACGEATRCFRNVANSLSSCVSIRVRPDGSCFGRPARAGAAPRPRAASAPRRSAR